MPRRAAWRWTEIDPVRFCREDVGWQLRARPGSGAAQAAEARGTLLVLLLATGYGLLLDKSVRSDPFAAWPGLWEWLSKRQPHPALAKIPVVPIGARGVLTFRPTETDWINSPYPPAGIEVPPLPNAGGIDIPPPSPEQQPSAPKASLSFVSSAEAAKPPQQQAPIGSKTSSDGAECRASAGAKRRPARRATEFSAICDTNRGAARSKRSSTRRLHARRQSARPPPHCSCAVFACRGRSASNMLAQCRGRGRSLPLEPKEALGEGLKSVWKVAVRPLNSILVRSSLSNSATRIFTISAPHSFGLTKSSRLRLSASTIRLPVRYGRRKPGLTPSA